MRLTTASSANDKNERSYTSTVLVYLHGRQRDNFTSTFTLFNAWSIILTLPKGRHSCAVRHSADLFLPHPPFSAIFVTHVQDVSIVCRECLFRTTFGSWPFLTELFICIRRSLRADDRQRVLRLGDSHFLPDSTSSLPHYPTIGLYTLWTAGSNVR